MHGMANFNIYTVSSYMVPYRKLLRTHKSSYNNRISVQSAPFNIAIPTSLPPQAEMIIYSDHN